MTTESPKPEDGAAFSSPFFQQFKPAPRGSTDVEGVGIVFFRAITGLEYEELSRRSGNGEGVVTNGARIVVMSAMDDDGVPLFDPGEVHDVAALPWPMLRTMIDAAYEASGLGRRDEVDEDEPTSGKPASGN